MPAMKCSTPSLLNLPDWWTPEQIREFQQWYDRLLTGNLTVEVTLPEGAVGAEINDRFYATKGLGIGE
jgi:hypothetical protein